jgi:hypothetical protein
MTTKNHFKIKMQDSNTVATHAMNGIYKITNDRSCLSYGCLILIQYEIVVPVLNYAPYQKTNRRVEVQLHIFLTLALDGGGWSDSCPMETAPSNHPLGVDTRWMLWQAAISVTINWPLGPSPTPSHYNELPNICSLQPILFLFIWVYCKSCFIQSLKAQIVYLQSAK